MPAAVSAGRDRDSAPTLDSILWYDFAAVIARLARNECDVRPIHTFEYPSKVKRPHYSVLDKTKFRETFGYKIPHWMESLEKCINQIKAQSDGI